MNLINLSNTKFNSNILNSQYITFMSNKKGLEISDIENFKLLKRLWQNIKLKRKKQLTLLIVLMIISGFLEIVSLATIIPFIGVITNPERLLQKDWVREFCLYMNITDKSELTTVATGFFIFAAITTGIVRLLSIKCSTLLAAKIGTDISSDAFQKIIYQDYESHINQNSSRLISTITSHTNLTLLLLERLLMLLTSLVIVIALLIGITIIAKQYILIFGISCALIYAAILLKVRKTLSKNSIIFDNGIEQQVKILQESIGGIRDIILSNSQKVYEHDYQKIDRNMREAWAQSQFLEMFPRYAIEAFGMTGLASLSYFLIINGINSQEILTLIGSLALATQRILPAAQQIYQGLAVLNSTSAGIDKVLNILDQKSSIYSKSFVDSSNCFDLNKFEMSDVSFKYLNSEKYVLTNVNLTIRKGERIGIIGKTGSGKSTLLDLIMGLFVPNKGTLRINNEVIYFDKEDKNLSNWRSSIAHVPQSIYLIDQSFKNNIAFGIKSKDIDNKRVRESASNALIDDFINTLPKKYKTLVGENGIKLSGGQRQRIGIARSLYRNLSILILDEATSALDNATEKKVMRKIKEFNPNLTIIICAHRLSTLSFCDRILKVENGNVFELKAKEIEGLNLSKK